MNLSNTKYGLFFFIAALLFSGGEVNAQKTRVKVLTFNILHGATTNGDFDLDKLAAVIKDVNPDIVALQEVDNKTNRAKGYDLVTELGWRTKMSPLFGSAMKYDGGDYGEGILSRYPFIETKNVALPHRDTSEPRAALSATIALPSGDTITFIATHLDHLSDQVDRIDQVEEIKSCFESYKYPTILAGDMNAEPESKAIAILKKAWTLSSGDTPQPTYPSLDPKVKIDYIMYAPEKRWRVVDRGVIADKIASDHCSYWTILELQ